MSVVDSPVGFALRDELIDLDATQLREIWASILVFGKGGRDCPLKPDGLTDDVWSAAFRSWGPSDMRRLVPRMIEEVLVGKEREEVNDDSRTRLRNRA
jgi:hypothetical protein